jgi:proline dehydrogenase
MLARALLLRASRSGWIASQFRRRSFARRAVRRFMPGEELADALAAAKETRREGIAPVFTHLGEQVTSTEEAEGVRDHYLDALERIAEARIDGQISVKLTQLGLLDDASECARRVEEIVSRAAGTSSFVWIDIEESDYVDATLEVFSGVRKRHDNVGLCLQAYLYRTPEDLATLLPLRPAIRLVKGAYREPASVAYPSKRQVDDEFFRLARLLLDAAARGGARPVFGTHDLALVARIASYAESVGATREDFEVHMLYGIRTADQRALAGDGLRVRVLISYGRHWFPWYVRRLAERPANMWFVVKSVFT